MKKLLLIVILFLLFFIEVAILFLWLHPLSPLNKEVLYIGLAGPMSGPNQAQGLEMVKGAEQYLDYLHQTGGELPGKKIKLIIFDDKRDKDTAIKVASEIVFQKKVLLVLGHEDSNTSLAAGKIYKRNEICAITASAIAEEVTDKNEWYFRIIPGNISQINLIANFIRNSLKLKSINLISDKYSYSSSLINNFEIMAKKLGICIKRKWEFDSFNKKIDVLLKTIAAETSKFPEPIFCAVRSPVAEKLIPLIKEKNRNIIIIGPDSLSKQAFINALKSDTEEEFIPGLYSDRILAVSPLIAEIADKDAYLFRQSFIKKYKKEPTRIAGCYYDAMCVAVEAIKKAEIQGKGHILSDRRKIRLALKSFYNYQNAIRGITGRIFFNTKGNTSSPPFMGFYQNQRFLPAFVQYQPILDTDQIKDVFTKTLKGDIILSDGKLMIQSRVVYTGMYINEISNLDIINSSYTADFYLWFRYKGMFDETRIEFLNAMNPVKLGMPVKNTINDKNVTFRVYRIKSDFKEDFVFHNYPFERHKLQINFQHADMTKDQLIFVADSILNFSQIMGNLKKTQLIDADDWQLGEPSFYQNTVEKKSSLGNPKFFNNQYIISYSRFNATIPVEKKMLALFIFKIFLPVIILMLIICFIRYVMPGKYSGFSISVLAVLFIANMLFHLNIFLDLTVLYPTTVDYAHFSVYIMIVISAFILVLKNSSSEKCGKKIIEKILIYTGNIIFFIIILSISGLQLYIYAFKSSG